MKNPLKIVAVIGLALGGALGMLGTLVSDPNLRAVSWAIDSIGLIVATALLALHFFRRGSDAVAAGFLVYSIGEAVMLSGTAGSLASSVPSFAAGIALWSAALLLTSVPRAFPVWTRIAGIIAAILFAFTSLRIFAAAPLTPISRPLPYVAYPFLVLTFIGWIVGIVRDSA